MTLRERSFVSLGDAYKRNVSDPWVEIFKLAVAHKKKTAAIILLQFLLLENAVHHIVEISHTSHGILEILEKVLLSFTGNGG